LGLSGAALFGPVPLGTAAGLFLGKQLGIFAFAWAAIRTNLADLPTNATWAQLYGVAILCGIGFTMSLFIGLLAFPTSAELQDATKVGVLAGSFAAAAIGAALLSMSQPEPVPQREGEGARDRTATLHRATLEGSPTRADASSLAKETPRWQSQRSAPPRNQPRDG
jgi:Na+/H+ antiporter 1